MSRKLRPTLEGGAFSWIQPVTHTQTQFDCIRRRASRAWAACKPGQTHGSVASELRQASVGTRSLRAQVKLLRDSCASLLTRRVQQDQVNADAHIRARRVRAGQTDKVSGHVPPIYPINAGGFRPNVLALTLGITAIRKNTLKNQGVDFVARAMHKAACGRIGRPGINSIPHVKEICNVCTFQD